MLMVMTWQTTFLVAVVLMGGYYFLLHRSGILKEKKPVLTTPQNLTTDLIPIQKVNMSTIGTAADAATERFPEPEEDLFLELLEENDSILLKEAERVVEEIQDTLDHIASSPANPEEVTTKIKAIVSPYSIFLETEYYDSINAYIAMAVERDCGISFSREELQHLWN